MNKQNARMFKSGKQWVIAAAAVAAMGGMAVAHQSASADLSTAISGLFSDMAAKATKVNVVIALDNSGIVSDNENAASVSGDTITIKKGGTYTVTGSSDHVQIVVAAPADADVNIVLNNADLRSTQGTVINGQSYGTMKITAAGTNSVTDAKPIADQAELDAQPTKSAIYSTGDLTFDASSDGGVLNVRSTMKGVDSAGHMSIASDKFSGNITSNFQ
ncbi:carbohydrate-binding domain-containing protein [Eupransor demetentiae]|uniref:Twin-arginine protein secretion pathway component TatC (TatC) n=1 Tax=Eupransor demetentiae TaxID=3109584 RepID=A0ABM9N481_9LACO|nr:Twin-arginine protein secretion pathway component TatC (TatC) [Lactobacillaceae bacterium LMG 33000]